MRRFKITLLIFMAVIIPEQGRSSVADCTASGFLVRCKATIRAPADSVYRALTRRIADWWDPAHTFSGDAKNLSLDPRPGGCFCETLPGGGGVSHLTVVHASPGKILRLIGALGPLQGSGLAGSMTWGLFQAGDSSRCEVTYSVGGYHQGGFQEIAPAVDQVLHEQLLRLKGFTETGKPEAK